MRLIHCTPCMYVPSTTIHNNWRSRGQCIVLLWWCIEKHLCSCFLFSFFIFFIFGFWRHHCSLWLVICSSALLVLVRDTVTLRHWQTLRLCTDSTPIYRPPLCATLVSIAMTTFLSTLSCVHHFHLPSSICPLDSIRTPSLSSFVLYSVPLLKLKYEAILFQLFTCRPPTCQTLRTGPLLTFHFPLDCPTYLWSFQRNQNVNYLCTMYFQVGMWSLGWAIGVQLRCPPTNWKQIEEREVCWRSPHSSHAVYQTHFSTRYCSSGRPTCCRAVRQDHCWALIWCSWLNWHFGV